MSTLNLNSLHTTIQHLKEVIDKCQGKDNETLAIVKQIEFLVVEIERKAKAVPTYKHAETSLAVPLK